MRSQYDSVAPSPHTVENQGTPAQAPERAALLRKRRDEKKDDVDWKSVAARLQADMVNFRKRQENRATDEILREKQRLLREFLVIVDQFEAILKHIDPNDATHTGVQLAYDAMMVLLQREGVERMAALDAVFDPTLHEAVAQVKAESNAIDEPTVVDVTLNGYTMGKQLLRPAKVVVAIPA